VNVLDLEDVSVDEKRQGEMVMQTSSSIPIENGRVRRLLAVADWDLDPETVVAEMRNHGRVQPAQFGLLVPARLHGLDWVGDPRASRPCAERQLLEPQRLCRNAGIDVGPARIGDPEATPATVEALADWPAHQILIFWRRRRVGALNPLSLNRRVRRATGLSVTRVDVSAGARNRGPRQFGRRCEPLQGDAAWT
jgi:hypothetical protein